jgi:hypothetical protein
MRLPLNMLVVIDGKLVRNEDDNLLGIEKRA